jgi:hypothetical protein
LATLVPGAFTYSEWALRHDPQGKIASMVNMMSQSNGIIDDMLTVECQSGNAFEYTQVVKLPTPAAAATTWASRFSRRRRQAGCDLLRIRRLVQVRQVAGGTRREPRTNFARRRTTSTCRDFPAGRFRPVLRQPPPTRPSSPAWPTSTTPSRPPPRRSRRT